MSGTKLPKRPVTERVFTLTDLANAFHAGCDSAGDRISKMLNGEEFTMRNEDVEAYVRTKAEGYDIEYPLPVVQSSGGEEG